MQFHKLGYRHWCITVNWKIRGKILIIKGKARKIIFILKLP